MALDEIYLGEKLPITEAYNSLLENKKDIVRAAYDPSGIYQFWEEEFKVCNKKEKIFVCREDVYKKEWANGSGGKNFYNSLIEKYKNKERIFALYRYRTERAARVLTHENIPLLGDVEIDFLNKNHKDSPENINKLTLTFYLNNQSNLTTFKEKPSKSDLINEHKRLKAVEYRESRILKFWHGIFQNRITAALEKKNIRYKTEFLIEGRRIDIVSFHTINNRKFIDIYEVKTAADRIECERQSIVQLIDYYRLAVEKNYRVRKLITVGPEKSNQGWRGRDLLENEISNIWEYQSVPD